MNTSEEDIVIKIWNKLDGVFYHHLEGSDFWPISEESRKRKLDWKTLNSEHELFYIFYREIRPLIGELVSKDRQKELQ